MLILKEIPGHAFPHTELVIKKSVFKAEMFFAEDATAARERVKQQKERYRDARHVVHAFVIGKKGEILGCSDDGEPAGTAGQPVLAVLKGSGITHILITVTRWFGGTLLGTGGLVKAYTNAAKTLLEQAPAEPLVETKAFSFTCTYEAYRRMQSTLAVLPLLTTDTEFTECVTIRGSIPVEQCPLLADTITQLTKGTSQVHFYD